MMRFFPFIFLMISACSWGPVQGQFNYQCDHDLNELHQGGLLNWFRPSQHPKGVVIVIGGLNLKPSKMNLLIDELTHRNLLVLRVDLKGHRGSIEEMKNVVRLDWMEEVMLSYCVAKEKAQKMKIPKYFIGYSLGALVMLDFISSQEKHKVAFDKMILLAPAFATKWYIKMVKILGLFGESFVIPSKNLKSYRANKGTSISAYESLFESQKALRKNKFKNVNVDTLVFIDPQDELIDSDQVRKDIKNHHLNLWQIKEIKKSEKSSFHHLMIDHYVVGVKAWEKMMNELSSFLDLK